LLTRERSTLTGGYINGAAMLNAYLRYFLPWNVLKLSRLLPSRFAEKALPDGGTVIDLGSGPLTVPLAFWVALPAMRDRSLSFVCVDRNGAALDAGKRLFHALAGDGCRWKIRTMRAALDGRLGPIGLKGADLVTAVNVANELFQAVPQGNTDKLEGIAAKFARLLAACAGAEGRLLAVEPGVPRSAQALSVLRTALTGAGFAVEAPCTHAEKCAMAGGRKGTKWCHFNINAEGAPEALRRLSERASLPKEKLTLSFLLAARGGNAAKGGTKAREVGIPNVRVISDSFLLPGNKEGRYACCEKGLTLISGEAASIARYDSGSLFRASAPASDTRDQKTGALLVEV
jgi:hypothetical protein